MLDLYSYIYYNCVHEKSKIYIKKDEWKKRMAEFKDTSNRVPDSWEYEGIRIVLFVGEVKNQKKNFNFAY